MGEYHNLTIDAFLGKPFCDLAAMDVTERGGRFE